MISYYATCFISYTKRALLIIGCSTPFLTHANINRSNNDADIEFFKSKKDLLTAIWSYPFGYDKVKSNHAPKGPYLGNGDVGATSFTSSNSQTLQISKVDFVTDGWSDWAGSGAAALPAGGVSITIDSKIATGFSYQMDQLDAELRMTTGTVNKVNMTTWMSMSDNFIVTELTTKSNTPVGISVETYAGATSPLYATTATTRNGIAQVTRRTKTEGEVRWISQVGISTSIIGNKAIAERISDSKVKTTFTITSNTPTYLVVYVSGGSITDNALLSEAYEKLKSQNARRITALKNGKEAWWRDMWTRSYVETNDSLLNRHYLSSIYLMASAYNKHSPTCGGMYGVWNMDDKMMYHGDIHLNYNSQAGFYSMFSANRCELATPFYNFIDKIMPEAKQRAKVDMGSMHPSWQGKSCRGMLMPVSALGIGVFYGGYWQQTMNAPFNIPLYSWYYEYMGDKIFLRNKAYPYIRECGDFYEDYLQKEVYGNSYRYTITTGGHEDSWDLNPPSDLAFVEQTFRLLLRYSEILDVDAGRRELWRDILTHLPHYTIIMPTKEPNQKLPVYAKNEAGWDLPNHVIQLHSVYPCEGLNLHSDSISLEIARNTLYYYCVSQQGFTEKMNELGLSAFIMGARMGFSPDILVEKMRTLIKRAETNFLITDGHHCMEKTTVVETINSMMLQTVEEVLYLFPCWTKTPASFTRLRAKGAFLVSADYDGTTVTALKIKSEKGMPCKLLNPWSEKNLRVTENGRLISTSQDNGICSFATKEGYTYEIQP